MKMVDKEYALVCDDGDWSPFIVSLDLAEEVHRNGYPTRPQWKYETISLWWLIEAEWVVDAYQEYGPASLTQPEELFAYAFADAWETGSNRVP